MKNFYLKHSVLFLLSFLISHNLIAQTTYKDVAPIFIANCTSCHHPGGIQFPLTKYYEVFAKSGLIKNAVSSGEMPPWPADPSYKHYVKERIVSPADKTLLIDWVDNGMLAGDTSLAPAIPTYGNTQLNGTPDLILSLPKYTSTASTVDKYICVNVPVNLTQDRYIRAFEFLPGNAAIIHHAVITIDTTGTAVDDYSGNCTNFQGQINIGDYAPGMGPTVLPRIAPTKFGFRLKAGSKMSFQLHLPEGTAGEKDSSELRIFFYLIGEPNIRDMFFETALQNWSFYIPPNDSVIVTAKYPSISSGIPVDISLYGAFPHSHNTCTGILNFAYKNADTIPLIRIPKWDFHWQMQYTFNNMVKFPQGYHLFAAHKFDNTTNNPHTPNHNAPVYPGNFTTDEMLFDSYLYALYQTGDETVDIATILASDPLFFPTSANNVDATLLAVRAYPNPFQTATNIEYTLLTSQFVQIHIYSNTGQKVNTIYSAIESSGFHKHQWDGTDYSGNKLPPGTYMYTIKAGNKSMSGKVVLE